MNNHTFQAVNTAVRLHSGPAALEYLPKEISRLQAKRVFIFCGKSVAHKTNLIKLLGSILDDLLVGVFDGIDKDASLEAVLAAKEAAQEAKPDVLIAVGAGSVIKAVRIVAILMAENKPIDQLMTLYPQSGGAISQKLYEPKLPIINILTAPTNAQNRAGAALKSVDVDHRVEFFDPKTKPYAIFWDSRALSTAPINMNRNTGVTVFWLSLMGVGALDNANILVQGDRLHAFRLAHQALPRMASSEDLNARIEMCAAAFLQNREEQDGSASTHRVHWVSRVVYAVGSSLFNIFPEISQGEAYTALTASAIRCFGDRDRNYMSAIAEVLDDKLETKNSENIEELLAFKIENYFSKLGYPVRLRDLNVPKESFLKIIEFSTKNFNADPKREFLKEKELLTKMLEMAW